MVFERGFVRLAAVVSVLWLLHAGSNPAFGILGFSEFNSGTFNATTTAGTVLNSPTVIVTVDGYSFTGDSSVQVDAVSPSDAGDVTVTLRGDLLFTIPTPTVETINSFITVYAGSSGAATLAPQQSSLQTELLPAFFNSFDGNYYYDIYDPVGGPSDPLALSATGTNSQGLPGYSASEVIGPFLASPSDPNRVAGLVRDTNFFDLQWTATLTFTNVDPSNGPETLNILLPGGAKMDPVAPEPASFALWGLGATLIGGFTHWRRRHTNFTAGV